MNVPLHLQEKFERRWAARFASVASTVRKTAELKQTIVKASRPAQGVQGLQIAGSSCFPRVSERSA